MGYSPGGHKESDTTEHTLLLLSRFSRVQLFVTLWTVAHQTPLSKGFSRQEYWNGLPFLFSGDFPDPGIELTFLHWQVGSFFFFLINRVVTVQALFIVLVGIT